MMTETEFREHVQRVRNVGAKCRESDEMVRESLESPNPLLLDAEASVALFTVKLYRLGGSASNA